MSTKSTVVIAFASLLVGIAIGLALPHREAPNATPPASIMLHLTLEWDPSFPPSLECVPTRESDRRVTYSYKDQARCLKTREAVLNLLHQEMAREQAP